MGRAQKQKRRGGARDDSFLLIGFSRLQLLKYYIELEKILGISFDHTTYSAKNTSSPLLWRKVKKEIRKNIDGWQQELPFLF